MLNANPFRSVWKSALLVALFVATPAGAAGIQAVITTAITDDVGTNGGDFQLFLNASPLPIVAEQTVMLQAGDVLSASASAFASGTGSGTHVGGRNVVIDLVLPAGTTSATVQNVYSGSGESMPDDAYGGSANFVDCDFTQGGCSAPGLPLSTAFTSAVQSSTFAPLPSEITINNVTTPTGREGGVETLDQWTTVLELQHLPGSPSARTTLRALAQVIFNASSSGEGTVEITVTDVTVVPIPAAAWLFGSALGMLGWMRRSQIARYAVDQ